MYKKVSSLYPTTMRDINLIKLKNEIRKRKLNKINERKY